jgi:uncharacterized membrane protein YhiD involved in acid resistance
VAAECRRRDFNLPKENPTMAVKKFLKQVAELFDAETKRCKDKKVCMAEAVSRLQARQAELEARLAEEQSDKARDKLGKQLKVVTAKRQKGEKMLQEMEV